MLTNRERPLAGRGFGDGGSATMVGVGGKTPLSLPLARRRQFVHVWLPLRHLILKFAAITKK